MRRDIVSDLDVVQTLDPDTVTGTNADVNAAETDMQGNDSLMVLYHLGESGDTLSGSVYLELKLQHSDTSGSGFVAVPQADMLSQSDSAAAAGVAHTVDAAAEDDATYKVGYRGSKRYVRAVIGLVGANTNGTPVAVTAIKGHGHVRPE